MAIVRFIIRWFHMRADERREHRKTEQMLAQLKKIIPDEAVDEFLERSRRSF